MKTWYRLTATVLLGVSVGGCGTREVHPSVMLTDKPPRELVITTTDGRHIELEHAYRYGNRILGVVAACDGAPAATDVPPKTYRMLDTACARPGERGAISIDRVAKIEAPDTLSSGEKAGIIAGAVLGTLAVAAVATVAVLRSELDSEGMGGFSGSCPRVYSFDGEGWQLDSGTYGSAFFEAQQQTDHDLLDRLVAIDGSYRLRLQNELDETEHVDALRLTVVDHPAGSEVVPAPDGELISFVSPRAPTEAVDLRAVDALEQITARDGHLWQSDLAGRDPSREEDTRDGLRMSFDKPPGARAMKLLLTGMSTRSASNIVAHVMALYGDELPALYDRLNGSAVARALLRRLIVEVGLLSVWVRTPSGWSQRGVFEAAGNEIAKSQALRIATDDILGDHVEVRIESAVGMWMVDQVAADFSPDVPLTVRRLAAGRAVAHDGRDVSAILARIDGQRLSSERGEWAELTFAAPPAPHQGLRRSIVIDTSGYDTLHVASAAEPDPAEAQALMLSPMATSRRVLELLLAASHERGEP
jgi:hypothetical protein